AAASVVQKLFSGWLTGKRNDGGITPITVKVVPLRLIVRPSTDLSPANCDCHREWLIRRTRDPRFSSCAVNPRPNSGETPSKGTRSHETVCPFRRRARVTPVRVYEVS